MNIIANENVYEPIIEYLRLKNNDVISVRDTPLSGSPDDEIFKFAVDNNLIVLTMDKDFTRILRFPPEKCGGIIVLKLYKMKVDETTEIFKKHFESLDKERISGNLVIISRDNIMIRASHE